MEHRKHLEEENKSVCSIPIAKQQAECTQQNTNAHKKCYFIQASGKSQHSLRMHPLAFHFNSIDPLLGVTSRLASLKRLQFELQVVLKLPTSEISVEVVASFNDNLTPLINSLLLALCDDLNNIKMLALHNIQEVFRLTTRLPDPHSAVFSFANAIVLHGLSLKCLPEIRLTVCRNICKFFPADVFTPALEPDIFTVAFDSILSALLQQQVSSNLTTTASSNAFCELLGMLDPTISCLIIESWAVDNPNLYILANHWAEEVVQSVKCSKTPINDGSFTLDSVSSASSSITCHQQEELDDAVSSSASWCSDDIDNILWIRHPLVYNDVSFLLPDVLFELIKAPLARLSVDQIFSSNQQQTSYAVASLLVKLITEFIESSDRCLHLFLSILMKESDEEEGESETTRLLLISHQLGIICVLIDLLIADSNFNIVLLGLSSFTNLLHAIHKQTTRPVTQWELDSLLFSKNECRYRTDGYIWVAEKAINYLQTAFTDATLPIRVSGSHLAAALSRLPGGGMVLVRHLAKPLLQQNVSLLRPSSSAMSTRSSNPMATKSSLRREAVDAVTVALLQLPSSDFDLAEICETILVPGLMDKKQLIREATLDCLSVVAHLYGDSNLKDVYTVISKVEELLTASSSSSHRVSEIVASDGFSFTGCRNNNHKDEDDNRVAETPPQKDISNSSLSQTFSLLETIRSRILRRQLPIQDNQGRILRSVSSVRSATVVPVSAGPSANMSTIEHTTREDGDLDGSGSALSERRKPSAGRLKGNLKLPWDPRDSAITSASSSLTVSPLSLPNLSSPFNPLASSIDSGNISSSVLAESRAQRRLFRNSEYTPSQNGTPNPVDVFDMETLSDHVRLCQSIQFDYAAETFPRKSNAAMLADRQAFGCFGRQSVGANSVFAHHSTADLSSPMLRNLSGSLNSLSTSQTALSPNSGMAIVSLDNPKIHSLDLIYAHSAAELPEITSIRSKASKRRALRVFAEAESSGVDGRSREKSVDSIYGKLEADLLDGHQPCLSRPTTKCIGRQLTLSTKKRTALPTQCTPYVASPSFPRNNDYAGFVIGRAAGAASPGRLDSSSCERRPVRGQHDLSSMSPPGDDRAWSPGVCPRRPDSMSPPSIDVVGTSMCPKGVNSSISDPRKSSAISIPSYNSDYSNENHSPSDGPLVKWSAGAQSRSSQEDDEEDKTLTSGVEGHNPRVVHSPPPCNWDSGGGEGDLISRKPERKIYPLSNEGGKSSGTCRATSKSRRYPGKSRDGSLSKNSRLSSSNQCGTGPLQSPMRLADDSSESVFNRLSKSSTGSGGLPPIVGSTSTTSTGTPSSALLLISRSDWEEKVRGLVILSELASHSPGAFANPDTSGRPQAFESVNQIVLAVTTECKNLRSQVSRQAVKTLSDLFRGLGKLMDPHIEVCVRILLGKTGEASAAFLRGEVAIALNDLTRSVNPNKALNSLLQNGLGHKNAAIRRQCAIQVSHLTDRLGANRILQSVGSSGGRVSSSSNLSSWGSVGGNIGACGGSGTTSANSNLAMSERIIFALGQFLLDSDQETRYYGRRILLTLQQSPDFERVVTRYLTGQPLRAIREASEYLQTKGLGEPPTMIASATGPRTVTDLNPVSLAARGCSAGAGGAAL